MVKKNINKNNEITKNEQMLQKHLFIFVGMNIDWTEKVCYNNGVKNEERISQRLTKKTLKSFQKAIDKSKMSDYIRKRDRVKLTQAPTKYGLWKCLDVLAKPF